MAGADHGHAGPGLSKRDFEKVLAAEAAVLRAPRGSRRRAPLLGHAARRGAHGAQSRFAEAEEPQALRVDRPHVGARAKALKEAGVQRVHHNVETTESYYPEVSQTVHYRDSRRRKRLPGYLTQILEGEVSVG